MSRPILPIVLKAKGFVDQTDPFFAADQPTPPAKQEYLAGLNRLVLGAVTTPYAVTGLAFDSTDSQDTYWNWAQMIAPASKAMQGKAARSIDPGGAGQLFASLIWSTTTAPDPDDQINVEPGIASGVDVYPPGAVVVINQTSDVFDASPAAGDDRLLELAEQRSPYVEDFKGLRLIGFSGKIYQSADVSAL